MKYQVIPVQHSYHWYNDSIECFPSYDFQKSQIFDNKEDAKAFCRLQCIASFKTREFHPPDYDNPDYDDTWSIMVSCSDQKKDENDDGIYELTFANATDEEIEILLTKGYAPWEIMEIESL